MRREFVIRGYNVEFNKDTENYEFNIFYLILANNRFK